MLLFQTLPQNPAEASADLASAAQAVTKMVEPLKLAAAIARQKEEAARSHVFARFFAITHNVMHAHNASAHFPFYPAHVKLTAGAYCAPNHGVTMLVTTNTSWDLNRKH